MKQDNPYLENDKALIDGCVSPMFMLNDVCLIGFWVS